MKQSEISLFFRTYKGEKCSRNQYYKNIRKGLSPQEAIKPISRDERYKKGEIKTKIFENELNRYYQQKGQKVDRGIFYQRIYQGRTKEEAIKKDGVRTIEKIVKKRPASYKQKQNIKKVETNNSGIDIKYSKEEADVFKKEYERMIKETEDERFETDNIEKARYLREKLGKLKAEYQLFISINNYYE